MFRQVLVPVDFGVCSVRAVHHACDLVRAIGGSLTLLHVLEDVEDTSPDGEAARRAESRLRTLAGRSRRPAHVVVEPGHGRPVAQVILAVAARLRAELLVLGPHGQADPDSRQLGRVTRDLLLEARLPVQVVPGRWPLPGPPGARWRMLAGEG
ncbi:universal stress protein [Deinococcus budaensis]|uniref:Nucleotide-binding universal stress UspA family protein n=1 Tax=Deinococcus budaensis TaxID=1665626 RepID=A0A7W8LPT6_9DEIO|nr:nucleotide-binding universal stress UspA family protein [Deinococcus budaensis]